MVLKKIGRIICWVITACGALLISAGILMLFIASLGWLRSGVWPTMIFGCFGRSYSFGRGMCRK